MKKEYIKPELIEEVLFTDVLMVGLSGEADPEEPAGGRGRRGSWGNLWGDED